MTEGFSSLQALIDAEAEPVFALDADLRYTAFNRAHAGVMRALYGAEIALGERLADHMTVAADREAASANLERALAGERVVASAPSGAQGHERCFEVVHTPLVDAAGTVVGVGVRASDVTEREREEAERSLLSDTIEASLNEIYVFSRETLRFLFVNEGARRNLGYSSAELAEMTPLDIKPEFTPDAFAELLQPLISHEKPRLLFHTVHQRADGSLYPAEVHLQLFDQRPDPVYLAVIQDITERSAAEAALRDSERRWREILVHTPQIGVTLDREGRMTFANRRFLDLTGWSAEEAIGQDWFELCVPARIRAEVRHVFDTTMARREVGGFSNYENAIITRGGELRDVVWSNVISRDEHGAIVEVTSLGVDITERRRAEKELQQSQALLQAAMDRSQAGIAIADAPDGRLRYVNQAGLMIRGGSSVEVVDQVDAARYVESWHILHHDGTPYTADEVPLARAVLYGETAEAEFIIRRDDQEDRVVVARAAPIHDAEGTVTAGVVVFHDITERQRAEEALRESEARLADVFNLAPLGYQSLDVQGRFLEVNPAWLETLGYRREDVIGRWFGDFLAPEYVESFRERFPVFKERGSIHSEFEMMHEDGERHVIAFEGRVGHWPDGTFKQTHCVLADITERKRAEEEIRRLNTELEERVVGRTAELEAANKELEAFAYSVSHDLRAPLRAIDGFSAMVLEDAADKLAEDDREHLERVRAAAQRMALLIDELLGLSLAARQEMQLAEVDITALATEVLAELAEAQPARRVETLVAPGLRGRADAALLRVILANLLGNAWKFTSKHPAARIEVGALDTDGERVFFVRDDGAGFDPAHAPLLFGAFQRLHSPGQFEGNGIGLATVQRLVTRHGGRVWAQAEVEQGATFFFTLEDPGA